LENENTKTTLVFTNGSVLVTAWFCLPSGFDLNAPPIDGTADNPAIDTTAVITDLKPLSLGGLYQVKVFRAIHFAQDDVTNMDFVDGGNGYDGT
jgi:hypothetical protein